MTQKNIIFALMIGASLATAPVSSADTLTNIHNLLSKNSLICADFTQTKQLRALTRPLISKGRLIFVAGKGVLWQVREPFATQVLIKKDALIKWNEDGSPQPLSLGQAPIFRALSQIFLAVFTGKLSGLQDSFNIEPQMNLSRWRLTLVPRDPNVASIIATLRVSGSQFVDELVIEEGRGDQTLIRFTGITSISCRLDAAEKGYFAQ